MEFVQSDAKCSGGCPVPGEQMLRKPFYSCTVLPNLNTVMDGTEPAQLAVDVQNSAEYILIYSFSTPDSGYLVALWTNGIAVYHDPGVEARMTISDGSASQVIGIDVLYGFEQELDFRVENGNLVINMIARDYPILIKLNDTMP